MSIHHNTSNSSNNPTPVRKRARVVVDLPVISVNEELDQQIEKVLNVAYKKEKVAKVDFLRECIIRGLKSLEQTLPIKNLKVGYFKANTIDGIYFCGDFLRNNEEVMPLDEFVTALSHLEERQEIATFMNEHQEEIYFKLVREYGISHYQYFSKQDGEKVDYNVFFKNSDNVFFRCTAESGFIAQQQAMAVYLIQNPAEANRDMKELAKDFKVVDKFEMSSSKIKR